MPSSTQNGKSLPSCSRFCPIGFKITVFTILSWLLPCHTFHVVPTLTPGTLMQVWWRFWLLQSAYILRLCIFHDLIQRICWAGSPGSHPRLLFYAESYSVEHVFELLYSSLVQESFAQVNLGAEKGSKHYFEFRLVAIKKHLTISLQGS